MLHASWLASGVEAGLGLPRGLLVGAAKGVSLCVLKELELRDLQGLLAINAQKRLPCALRPQNNVHVRVVFYHMVHSSIALLSTNECG